MRNRAVAAKKHACLAVSKGRGERERERDGIGRKKGEKKRGDLRREGRERDDRSVTKRP